MVDVEQPLVSIGMPVYNGAKYLREALDSLLAQEYSNFELIISDNASTDATEAICREYVARDARIQYHCAAQNQGAVWNFNRVFELSQGEYFMWAAFDDLRAPQYVSRCVEALKAEPEAAFCCTGIQFIDESGCAVGEGVAVTRSLGVGTRLERIKELAMSTGWYDSYGLIRRSTLAKTRLALPTWGGDVILVTELCLRGGVIKLPEKMFLYRVFTSKTDTEMASGMQGTAGASPIPVSYSHMALEMARAAWLAPLPLPQRLGLIGQIVWCLAALNEFVSRRIRSEALAGVRSTVGRGEYASALGLLGIVLVAATFGRLRNAKHLLHVRARTVLRSLGHSHG